MRLKILSFIWPAALPTALMMVALAGIPQAGIAATDPKPGHGKKADPFLTGDPFTLDQVLLLLKQDAIPMRRRKEAIENRGIAFPLSSDTLAKLESSRRNPGCDQEQRKGSQRAARGFQSRGEGNPQPHLRAGRMPGEPQRHLDRTNLRGYPRSHWSHSWQVDR